MNNINKNFKEELDEEHKKYDNHRNCIHRAKKIKKKKSKIVYK